MDIREQIVSLYERYGAPTLTNFQLQDIPGRGPYEAGVFTLADINGAVVLIRRTPHPDYPGLETFWWLPGGGHEAGERLDEAAVREFREETGLEVHLERLLVAPTKPLKGVLIGEGRQLTSPGIGLRSFSAGAGPNLVQTVQGIV